MYQDYQAIVSAIQIIGVNKQRSELGKRSCTRCMDSARVVYFFA